MKSSLAFIFTVIGFLLLTSASFAFFENTTAKQFCEAVQTARIDARYCSESATDVESVLCVGLRKSMSNNDNCGALPYDAVNARNICLVANFSRGGALRTEGDSKCKTQFTAPDLVSICQGFYHASIWTNNHSDCGSLDTSSLAYKACMGDDAGNKDGNTACSTL